MTRDDSPRALIRYGLAGLVLAAAIAWMLYLTRGALLLIYVSALIAIGLSPLVNAIERRRMARHRLPRWAAILVIYLLVIAVLVGVGLLVIPPLVTQTRQLWAALPELLHHGQQWLVDRGWLSREMSVSEAVRKSPVGGTDAVGAVIGALWTFAGGVFGVVTILILTFYLLVDANSVVRGFVRLFPRGERERVDDACRRVTTKLSAWLGGQLLLAGIIGTTAAIGLGLLGVPYFYVLALIAALGEMLPMVGPVLSAIPAIVVALTVSPTLAVGVVVFLFAQQQLENHVLVPKIMERQVGVSAVSVIAALLLGASLLGIVGAVLAVPTAAILQVLFEELVPDEH